MSKTTTASKTYSLKIGVIETIRDLADRLGKKQGQIIEEMTNLYAQSLNDDGDYSDLDDEALAVKCEAILDRIDRGEARTYTLDEIKAEHNARVKAAA